MLELSIELEKLDGAGNHRESLDAARPRGRPQSQMQPGPQTRSVLEHANRLSRILDVIPAPPQEYRPAPSKLPVRQDVIPGPPPGFLHNTPRLPARQEVIPAPRHGYRPNGSRLPALQDQYIGRAYAHRVTQIDVLPPARDWGPRRIEAPAPKTNEWRSYVITSFLGAVIGISGYAFLFHGGAPKGEAAKAQMPPARVIASAGQQPVARADDAFRERVSNQVPRPDTPSAGAGSINQPFRGDSPSAAMGYGFMAQSSGQALLERASNQLNQREVIEARAADPVPQPSDDALLSQAFYKLSRGDGLGARAAYEAVAQHGSALGALGLAETYDPNVLVRRRILGLKPDPSLARLWYERAAKLGSLEASKRLKQLTKPAHALSAPTPIPPSKTISSGSEVLRR
jgi:hypothetical protein